MNFNNEIENQDNTVGEEVDISSKSIEEFIRQLEAKEKDLLITADMSIEIDEIDFDDTNPTDFIKSEVVSQPSITPQPNVANPISNNNEFSEVKNENSKLKNKISQMEAERADLTTTFQRRQTDFDNYKKRIERSRNETFVNQVSNLAILILPVLDNMNRALDFAEQHLEGKSPDFQEFYRGIILVNQQLNEVLAEMGILPIMSVGEGFNPHFHEAVATEESHELPPNMITQELLRGYCIGDKVIRAAMVRVSTAAKPEAVVPETDSAILDEFPEVESPEVE